MHALLLAASVLTVSATDELSRYEYVQIRMGVPVKITLYAQDEALANMAARDAYARFKELNLILSDYDPRSELSRLSDSSETGESIAVSSELWFVLSQSKELSNRTDGAFDVTVGPVVKLWRKARRNKELPDQAALELALKRVDWKQIQLDKKAKAVSLKQPGMQLDLGGIAKGYAADEALKVLKSHGITRALIDAGGDIVVGDPPPNRDGWRIGIETADVPQKSPSQFVVVKNVAIATSGDAFQHVEIDGVRYSHIVDPKTGLGLTTRSSVTVIAPDGITADSLASAVSVLGPAAGFKLIEQYKGTTLYLVWLTESAPVTMTTSEFPEIQTLTP